MEVNQIQVLSIKNIWILNILNKQHNTRKTKFSEVDKPNVLKQMTILQTHTTDYTY